MPPEGQLVRGQETDGHTGTWGHEDDGLVIGVCGPMVA